MSYPLQHCDSNGHKGVEESWRPVFASTHPSGPNIQNIQVGWLVLVERYKNGKRKMVKGWSGGECCWLLCDNQTRYYKMEDRIKSSVSRRSIYIEDCDANCSGWMGGGGGWRRVKIGDCGSRCWDCVTTTLVTMKLTVELNSANGKGVNTLGE